MPSADGPFARACHAVTGGNPFLLVTLLAQLAADGVEPDEQTATLLDTFGPEQVTRSVARLAAGAAELAHAAAVLGPATPLRRAASLAGLHIDAAARAADSLRSAGLLDSGRQLTLAHPLIAAALYAGLPSGERGLRHAAAARLLAAEGAAAERVGLLLLQTEPAGDPATVHTPARGRSAAALRRANRRADARLPLRRALDQAERGGMRLLARRARDELHAAGARPRRDAFSGPGDLTPAEHRVARLAALGHSNRTIAERLYITQRSVETHLTHTFTKLNISTRTALARALDDTTVHAD